jgi:hypothetical protein
MTETFAADLPVLQSLLCLLLVVAFWWPAWRWLELGGRNQGHPLSQRMAMAFVTAFGVFTLLTSPMLLWHMSSHVAMTTLFTVWVVAGFTAEVAWRKKPKESSAKCKGITEVHQAQRTAYFLPVFLLSLAATISLALGFFPAKVALGLIGFCFLLNSWVVWKGAAQTVAIPTKSNPIASGLFFSLLAIALVSPAFHHRTDPDDNLYLSETLILQDSPAMGDFAPTHRGESLPANPVYALQSFELWGAMLARLSGLHTLIVMRSLLGPVLLLLSLGLYAALLRRILPAGLLQVGMVFLLAYFVFGISSHWTPNNYLLTRPQQGKTWLMHAGVLAVLIQSLQFLKQANRRNGLLLFLISCACLGWAPTAILLVPATLGSLALAHIYLKPNLDTVKHGLCLALCTVPQILFVVFLSLHEQQGLQEMTLGEHAETLWRDLFFFTFLSLHSGGGALELLALLAAPLLLLLFPQNKRQAYPVLFLAALAVFLLNPLLYGWIGDSSSGKWGYLRLFWLLPLPILFGALGAGVYASFLREGKGTALSTCAMLGLLTLIPMCGAHYVWSHSNLYSKADKGILMYDVENPYKMPQDLLNLANEMQGLPLGPEHRILAHLNEVTHLAPLVEEFDFVFTRDFQTPPPLIALGRSKEAQRREQLAAVFLHGHMNSIEAAPLLESELAHYVIVSPYTGDLSNQLPELNYSLRFESGPYELWVRD